MRILPIIFTLFIASQFAFGNKSLNFSKNGNELNKYMSCSMEYLHKSCGSKNILCWSQIYENTVKAHEIDYDLESICGKRTGQFRPLAPRKFSQLSNRCILEGLSFCSKIFSPKQHWSEKIKKQKINTKQRKKVITKKEIMEDSGCELLPSGRYGDCAKDTSIYRKYFEGKKHCVQLTKGHCAENKMSFNKEKFLKLTQNQESQSNADHFQLAYKTKIKKTKISNCYRKKFIEGGCKNLDYNCWNNHLSNLRGRLGLEQSCHNKFKYKNTRPSYWRDYEDEKSMAQCQELTELYCKYKIYGNLKHKCKDAAYSFCTANFYHLDTNLFDIQLLPSLIR